MAISKHFPFAPHIITCLLVSFLLLLSGCNQPDHAASSVPGSIQAVQEPTNRTTQAPVKKSKTLTPQEELEKLAPMPQTAQFIESRTETTADGTQRRYGTLAFSFEVENASFEAHLPIILKKLPDGSTQYETTADWFNVQAKPNRNATLPAAQQEAVPKWYVEQAQCAVYESSTDPARLILTVQGVLQDENWNRVPFSGSSEYYF